MRNNGNSNRRSGFTLTELLVSLVIFGLISMAATSALSVGKRIWGKVWTVPDLTMSEAERNVLRRIVRSRISAADEAGGGVSGTKQGLSFTGLARLADGSDIAGTTLMQLAETGITIRTSSNGSTQTLHLSQLKGADLSYYGRKTSEGADGWFDAWETDAPAPKLLRFSFSGDRNFGQKEIVIAVP
ncbi:MAG: prepilin-type N-terminal cleavage/methylation domain-containing protein [Pseudomonadota bacterium]